MYNNQNVKSFQFLQEALDLSSKLKSEELKFYCLINLGIVASKQTAFSQSSKYYNEANEIAIRLKNYSMQFRVKEAFGLNYLIQNNTNYRLSGAYFYEALKIAEENKDEYFIHLANKHRAAVKLKTSEFDEAVMILRPAAAYFKNISDYDELGDCQAYLGDVFYYQKLSDSALVYYQYAYASKIKSNNRDEMAILSTDIAYMYADEGKLDLFRKYSQESLAIIENTKNYKAKEYVYRWLAELYEKNGKYQDALIMHKKHSVVNDSIKSAKRLEEFAKVALEKEYELQIEKQRLENNRKLEIKRIENEQANRLKTIFMIAFAVALILVLIIFREYRNKKRQKKIIEEQKNLVEKQKEEVELQKDIIQEKNKEITDSINYAKRIQNAILQTPEHVGQLLKNAFIYYRPKDIVSGDFYWVNKDKDFVIVVVADCTGHGVPGGFMSMLGSGLLHEIVKEKGIHHPSQILNELRKKVMTALRQTGETGDSQDGMDVVVMKLYASNEMEYACANNGIVVVRGEETINLKGDKMPVGYSLKMDDFTNNEFQLNNGDWVYAYTDGYPDQFGGTSAKKFMYVNLNKLLKSISPNQASTQYNQLHETFEKWIHVEETGKTFEQIDDVCILGFRIGE